MGRFVRNGCNIVLLMGSFPYLLYGQEFLISSTEKLYLFTIWSSLNLDDGDKNFEFP